MIERSNQLKATTCLAAVALLLALVAISLGVFRGHDVRAPDPAAGTVDRVARGDLPSIEMRLRQLTERLGQLERSVAATGTAPFSPDSSEPARSMAGDPAVAVEKRLGELSTRLGNLEKAREREREEKAGLAAPDSIPAALAVLLATRGIVVKVGDIEAIQENLAVLAAIAADADVDDWHRIEAYRGMLMFGFDDPQASIDAMPGIAEVLATSTDPRVRRSAAAMLQNHRNPRIANTLTTALLHERDAGVREQIVGALLKLLGEPGVRQALGTAARSETDAALRSRIEKALAK